MKILVHPPATRFFTFYQFNSLIYLSGNTHVTTRTLVQMFGFLAVLVALQSDSSWALSTIAPVVANNGGLGQSTISLANPRSTVASLNQQNLEKKQFPRTWVPIASTLELDPDRPTPLEFLSQKYVTYQDNDKNWVVLDDVCPHRLAPLSEGRIDREKNVIQCSYHGWEFNSTGNCNRIPQADAVVEKSAVSSKRSSVSSYPVHVENGILFIWPWEDDVLSIVGKRWAWPEGMMEKINPVVATFTRDLPYGWGSLVENLIDPSHVPFAHHGLQGKRTDAIPINMTIVQEKGEEGFSFEWEDRTMGLMRSGQGGFRAPYMVWYDADFDSDTPRRFELSVFCVPTKPGWSRAIILNTMPSEDAEVETTETTQKKTKQKASLLRMVFKILPTWMLHMLSNRFLDSDLAFLHYQERELQRHSGAAYYMPAPADRCISALWKWIPKYTNISDPLPAPMPRSELFDRYGQHGTHCKHCQAGEKSIKKWRRRAYAALTASILGFKFRMAKVVFLLSLGFLRILQKLGKEMSKGDFRHYENH